MSDISQCNCPNWNKCVKANKCLKNQIPQNSLMGTHPAQCLREEVARFKATNKSEYLSSLMAMTDDALFEETKSKIWLSAYANNNPRSDYHWQCDATYDEWHRRDKISEYSKAHKQVATSCT